MDAYHLIALAIWLGVIPLVIAWCVRNAIREDQARAAARVRVMTSHAPAGHLIDAVDLTDLDRLETTADLPDWSRP